MSKPKITSKRWKPESEAELLDTWKNEDTYKFNMDSSKVIYTVDTPPPYLSGPMHVGQVTHYTQIDTIARYKRMSGFAVNFPLGIDRQSVCHLAKFLMSLYSPIPQHWGSLLHLSLGFGVSLIAEFPR